MKTQTAVEKWIQSVSGHNNLNYEQILKSIQLFQQANKMEKKQLKSAFNTGNIPIELMELFKVIQIMVNKPMPNENTPI